MEELPPDQYRQHNACNCVMCQPCIERTVEHHENDKDMPAGHIRCPGCRQNADPATEFISKSQVGISKPKLKMFTLPVIIRQNANGADDQIKGDKKNVSLLGTPTLLHVPNLIKGSELHRLLRPFIRIQDNYTLVLTDATGKSCSR